MTQKSKFDLHPHLLTILKEELRKDINVPTDKLFWLDEFQKFGVSKQSITAKRRAFQNNPALLTTPETFPADQKAVTQFNAFKNLMSQVKPTIPAGGFPAAIKNETEEKEEEEELTEESPKRKRKMEMSPSISDYFVPVPTESENVIQDPFYILFEGSEEKRFHFLLIRNICGNSEKGTTIDIDSFKVTVTWNLTMDAKGIKFPEIIQDFFPTPFEPRWTKVISLPTEIDKDKAELKKNLLTLFLFSFPFNN